MGPPPWSAFVLAEAGGCPQALLSHSPAQPHHLHCCFPLQTLIRPRRPSCFLQVDWLPPLLLMVPSWPVPSVTSSASRGDWNRGWAVAEITQKILRGTSLPPVAWTTTVRRPQACPRGTCPVSPSLVYRHQNSGLQGRVNIPTTESRGGPGGWSQDRHHLCLPPAGSGCQDLARPHGHVNHEGRQQARAGVRSTQAGAPGAEPWTALAPLWPPHPRQEKAVNPVGKGSAEPLFVHPTNRERMGCILLHRGPPRTSLSPATSAFPSLPLESPQRTNRPAEL